MIPRKFLGLVAVVVALAAAPLRADDQEQLCRKNLETLAEAIKSYRLLHDNKSPPNLSDLYYESYADDVARYRCPSVEGGRLLRTEIDDKSDYTIEQVPGQPALLVRERQHHHGDGSTVLAVLEDGSIKAIQIGGDTKPPVIKEQPGEKQEPAVANKPKVTQEKITSGKDDDAIVLKLEKSGDGQFRIVPDGGKDGVELPEGATITITGEKPPIDGPAAKADKGTLEDSTAKREPKSGLALRGGGLPFGADQQVALADSIYEQGGYDAALDFYERALEADAKNEKALLGRGRASIRTGALRQARLSFESVLKQNPGHVEARRQTASINMILGETKLAAQVAEKLHTEQPNDADVALLYAQAALYSGDDAEAAKRFAIVAKSQPDAAENHRTLGDEYMDQRLLKLALLHYRTAVALDPADETSLLNAATAATKLADKKQATHLFEEYLRRFPTAPEVSHVKAELKELKQK